MTGKTLRPLISSIRASLWASLLFFPTALFALGLGDIRLKSALNEPLDAEIELISATPDELASLRASLASRETFTRYGLERPQFLANLDFRVGRSGDGRSVLFVRSRESVTEPFLTFLIEVNWSRGRLLREYTVLMDPPVYMPGEESASAPVSAPQTSVPEPSSGRVERPVEAPVESAPPPAPAVSRPAAPISADAGSYTVRQNDTLWQIASGLRPGSRSDVNRMMIALFQANPEAFVGNINRLKAGAILRIPGDGEFDALAASDAAAEVRRQTAEWRETRGLTAAAAAGEEARLRLVTPTEGGEGTGVTTPSTTTPEPSQPTAAAQPGTQPAPGDAGRLPVQDPELARLQQQQQPPAATAEPAPAEQPAETPVTTSETAAPGAEGTPAEEPAATAPPTVEPARPVPAAETEGPGFFETLPENWWLFLIGGLVLIGGAVVFFSMRRKEPDVGALGRLARAEEAVREMNFDREPREPATGTTASMRAPKIKEDAFLVEESGEHAVPRAVRTSEMPRVEPPPPRVEPARTAKADQTLSSETAINLDQGDPLAEADFHMAYGLYDQAADLVRIAIEREPQRRDLKLKLLEIFFVWGNKDSFLQTARQLRDTRGPAGEWDKIAIMGRQIAPEDALFAGGAGGAHPVADVDLNLEGGENRVDLDLLGPPEGEGGGGIDLDLGGVLGGTGREEDTAITGESPALKGDEGLDFVLDDDDSRRGAPDSATTREMAAARTQETPTIETAYRGSDVPTVESPALRDRGSSTIKEKIDSALFRKESVASDQTAELALDDLGLDLDDLRGVQAGALDDDQDHPSDAATMVAGMDEKSRRLLAEAEARNRGAGDSEPTQSPTGTWVMDDKTLAATMALPGADTSDTARMRNQAAKSDTARRKKLDADSTAELARLSADDMDLDLDRLEQALKGDTVKQQRKGAGDEDRFSSDVFGARDHDATDLDVDVGDVRNRNRDRTPTATSRIPADEMSLPELEPVTMSEVGTKLDLARAYMDMGDPEGARSILDEVLQEGSATQKQEAQRLIDSLPG